MQEHGGETIIPFSGVLERNLADMSSPAEVEKYCEENKIQRRVSSLGFCSAKDLCGCGWWGIK